MLICMKTVGVMVGMVVLFGGNVSAMQQASQRVSTMALLASARASRCVTLPARISSRGFASSNYDPAEGNDVIARFREILPRTAEGDVVRGHYDARERVARKYNSLKSQGLSSAYAAEFKEAEKWLQEDDEKLFAMRSELEEEACDFLVKNCDRRSRQWLEFKEIVKTVMVMGGSYFGFAYILFRL